MSALTWVLTWAHLAAALREGDPRDVPLPHPCPLFMLPHRKIPGMRKRMAPLAYKWSFTSQFAARKLGKR